MIPRALLVTLLLLGGYELLFRVLAARYMPRADSVPVLNAVNAQHYLYERADAEVVIVGSSLSGRLHTQLLDAHTINLAFGGMSAFDGLEIIKQSKTRPQLVLIEANVLNRPANASFLKHNLAQPLVWLRRPIWAMRDVARPLTVTLSYVQALLRRLSPERTTAAAIALPASAVRPPVADGLFARMLNLQRDAYAKALPDHERGLMLDTLRDDVTALAGNGVHIAFFELPTHPELCEMPLAVELRKSLHSEFPEIAYVRILGCAGIQTTDGVHLTTNEAGEATLCLRRLIDQQIKNILRAEPSKLSSVLGRTNCIL